MTLAHSTRRTSTQASTDARSEALAAEHAAVWTYGVLAARTSASANPGLLALLRKYYEAHLVARDALLQALAEVPGGVVTASPSYPLPSQLGTPSAFRRAAADVERHCNEVYAWVVSQTTALARANAITALSHGAVREAALRGATEAFPGAADLAAQQ